MSDSAIKVEGLGKRFSIGSKISDNLRESIVNNFNKLFSSGSPNKRDFWALKDLNFEIKRGEATGIIGKNGAGKSTLLKILSRITEPTTGRIEINGRVSSLLEVGTGFHPELTGRENIFLNGTILGMRRPEIKSKFDEIVEFSGVENFIDTPVKHYSSGMKVRLAFSVAAHLEPEILIIDEVLAVGDADFQKKCLGKMEDVAGQGRTVLFVSHNMSAVEQLCTECVLIEDGKLKFRSSDVTKVVSLYLTGDNAENNPELLEWKKISNKHFNEVHSITRFAILNKEGVVLPKKFTNNNMIWVQIEGEVNKPDENLNIGYILYNSASQVIYRSFCKEDVTSNSWFHKKGKFQIKTAIPEKFLNQGHYRIELVSVLHNIKWLMEPGSGINLNFDVTGGYKNIMVSPKFEWYQAN